MPAQLVAANDGGGSAGTQEAITVHSGETGPTVTNLLRLTVASKVAAPCRRAGAIDTAG